MCQRTIHNILNNGHCLRFNVCINCRSDRRFHDILSKDITFINTVKLEYICYSIYFQRIQPLKEKDLLRTVHTYLYETKGWRESKYSV